MSSGTHILFVNEFFHPDICASAAVISDHLPRIAKLRPDFQITVMAGNRAWDDPTVEYEAEADYQGVRIVRVDRPVVSRTNLVRRALGFAAFQRNAIRLARRLAGVDLVVGTTAPPQGGGVARKIAKKRECPYIYKVLDLYPDLAATLGRIRDGGFLYRRWLATDTKSMREAKVVVTVADRMVDRIVEERGIPREKTWAIHDGFDPARVGPVGENRFAHSHNPKGRFVVQYAGNMGLSHPFETILDAANRLAVDNAFQFQFIGDGPHRGYVEKHLPANARLIDYQPADRLREVLGSADICLISQHDDMFDKALPYKVFGILAAGKPAIFVGNRRSEIVEWLEDVGAGVHVNQGDSDRLAAVIREIQADGPRATAMGEAARRLLDERFHSDIIAQRWVEAFEFALGRQAG